MSGRINPKIDENLIDSLSASDAFTKLTPETQLQVLNASIDNKKSDAGIIGSFLGTAPQNVSLNIVFIICVILLLILSFLIGCSELLKKDINMDLVSIILPIISLTIGYLFGKQ